MAFTKKNEEAVSPVIGVILMVAITVILAAVIAAFVFGMAGNVAKTKLVAVTASRPSTDTVTITNMGGPDQGNLNSAGLVISGFTFTGSNTLGKTTGSTKTVTGVGTGKQRVLVTGTFSDSTQQVLLDTFV